MILVPIILISARDGRREALGNIGIENEGTGTETVGNYKITFFGKGRQPRKIKEVFVRGHRRKAESIFRLLLKALHEGYARGEDPAFDPTPDV